MILQPQLMRLAARLSEQVYSLDGPSDHALGSYRPVECESDHGWVLARSERPHWVIVFAGTDDWPDWLDNLRCWPRRCMDLGRVHPGFGWDGYRLASLCRVILPEPKVAGRVLVTGHSRGGALAMLVAERLRQVGYAQACITFGAPRAWPRGRRLQAETWAHVAGSRDPVPYSPRLLYQSNPGTRIRVSGCHWMTDYVRAARQYAADWGE